METKLARTARAAIRRGNQIRKLRRAWPYIRIAKLYEKEKMVHKETCPGREKGFKCCGGELIPAYIHPEIARAIGRVDKNPKDRTHSLRNCLHRMFNKGYINSEGKLVKLKQRVDKSTIRACRRAGQSAWVQPKRKKRNVVAIKPQKRTVISKPKPKPTLVSTPKVVGVTKTTPKVMEVGVTVGGGPKIVAAPPVKKAPSKVTPVTPQAPEKTAA
jgi:hypothetical protein